MAKKGSIEKNKRRQKLAAQYTEKRKRLKDIAHDQKLSAEERFAAHMKLAQLPRNSAPNRVRNRCEVTGRPRGYYRKLRMCRNQLRELASRGLIPGMVKSSW
ncbi:MAG: 30S ribosomal protein S14 [Alphaproteobacteria bacterium]|nr:30S ribosomal protein S14 [Alphaproteobacteria bacterium]